MKKPIIPTPSFIPIDLSKALAMPFVPKPVHDSVIIAVIAGNAHQYKAFIESVDAINRLVKFKFINSLEDAYGLQDVYYYTVGTAAQNPSYPAIMSYASCHGWKYWKEFNAPDEQDNAYSNSTKTQLKIRILLKRLSAR